MNATSARGLGWERGPTTPPPHCAANPSPTASQPDRIAGALQIRRVIIGNVRAAFGAPLFPLYPPKPKPQRGDETSRGFGASHEGRSLQKGPSTNTIIHFWRPHVRAVVSPWLTSLSGSPRLPSSSVRSLNAIPADAHATSQEGGMTHIATPAPASMPNMKTTTPMVIFAGRPGHSGSRGGAILLGAGFVTGSV